MSLALPGGREIDAVVIGTSAGGVEALTMLLPHLPAGLAAPVFIVLHLPRERPSPVSYTHLTLPTICSV